MIGFVVGRGFFLFLVYVESLEDVNTASAQAKNDLVIIHNTGVVDGLIILITFLLS